MATLNPTIGEGIGYEQPVTSPSVLSSVLQAGATILGNVGTPSAPRAPTSAELQNNALSPYAQRLEELRGSDLTDAQFTRQARLAERQFLQSHPEYASEAREIAGNYGVETEELAVSSTDALTEAQNEWITSPAGIEAMNRVGPQAISDGQLDESVLTSLLQQEMAADLALDASVTRSNQRLTLLENDVAAWRAGSEQAMGEILPQLTARSNRARDSLIALATSGDTTVDTPQEQIAFLRQQRVELRNGFLADVQSANVHQSVYEDQLNTALQPIDDLINMFEASAGDTATILTATRNARALEFENELVENFGLWAANPEFMQQGAALFAQQLYDVETMQGMVAVMNSQHELGAYTGLDFLPGLPRPQDAYESGTALETVVAPEVSEALGVGEGTAEFITHANSIISSTDDPAVVFRNFGHIVSMAGHDGRPLGAGLLGNIFSPENVRTYGEMIGGGDAQSQDMLASLRYFQGTQVTRNQEILEGALTNFPNLSVEFRNNQLVLLEGGEVRRGVVNNEPRLTEIHNAIEAINTINTAMRRIDPMLQDSTGPLLERESDFMDGLGSAILGAGTGTDFYSGGGEGDDLLEPRGNALRTLIDREEGSGGYDTLFGFSQRNGNRFSGVDVSQMTLGELRDFASPSGEYGGWVRGQVGRVATPMGRYQIVGTTLRGVANALGLSDDTVFDETTQDLMFDYLVTQRLNSSTTRAGQITGLRNEWEGFRHISDEVLSAAIDNFLEGGEFTVPTTLATRATSTPQSTVAGAEVRVTTAEAQAQAETEARTATRATESAPQAAQVAAVSTPSGEQVVRTQGGSPEATSTGSSQTQSEQLAAARVSSAKILSLLGQAEESVPRFASPEELNRAIEAGSVKPEDVVLVAGEVRVV